ncbi:hypothetical protein Tco_1060315 [Tanacetum coccineum]
MLVRQAYSPTAIDTESEPLEAPSKIEEPQPLSLTSAPPSPDYTSSTSHTDDESEPLETFETRTPSSSSSPTLRARKRYQGTFELIADTKTESDELEDEGTESGSKEAASEDQQQ